MKKLNRVLLVDDDDDANHFQEKLFRKYNFAENVDKVMNGADALEYLNKGIKGEYDLPEIIFLDLNMPRMDGWTFLEKYNQFSDEIKAKIVLIILTSSVNPDDEERAKITPEVKGYKNKFLHKDQLTEIMKLMPI
ncbi:MAG TPA: response regulator [Chitinophagales bacterium]|nr:response regulator [Chitinophagales bacterium]